MSSARWSGGSSKDSRRTGSSHRTRSTAWWTAPGRCARTPRLRSTKAPAARTTPPTLCAERGNDVWISEARKRWRACLPKPRQRRRRVIISPRSRADTGRAAVTRQAFVAWLLCASGVALAGTHVLVATQENSQTPPAARNYWAFKLPVQSAVPETATRFDNPIDRFLEKARGDRGLEPAPRASRLALMRRAYLDLIRLPPSPAETAAFLADD